MSSSFSNFFSVSRTKSEQQTRSWPETKAAKMLFVFICTDALFIFPISQKKKKSSTSTFSNHYLRLYGTTLHYQPAAPIMTLAICICTTKRTRHHHLTTVLTREPVKDSTYYLIARYLLTFSEYILYRSLSVSFDPLASCCNDEVARHVRPA